MRSETLGERESGTARLEEAVAAYRAALEERTRERVPLDWATSFGNQGVALMLIADRTNDAASAETAVAQIEAAYETLRSGGQEAWAAVLSAATAQGPGDPRPAQGAVKAVGHHRHRERQRSDPVLPPPRLRFLDAAAPIGPSR